MKFKLMVERVYYKEVIVEADDKDHALEIAMEVSDFMDTDETTFAESSWDAESVGDNSVINYEPIQEYLK